MFEKIALGVLFLVVVIGFYYFFDDLLGFVTEPDNQVTLGQSVGITRAQDRR
jgi:hypothetical protein